MSHAGQDVINHLAAAKRGSESRFMRILLRDILSYSTHANRLAIDVEDWRSGECEAHGSAIWSLQPSTAATGARRGVKWVESRDPSGFGQQ